MSLFDTYKHLLNPKGLNPVSGNEVSRTFYTAQGKTPGIDVLVGPTVIAEGVNIPIINPDALIVYDALRITGMSSIGDGAQVRRGATVQNSVLGPHTLFMDFTSSLGEVGERIERVEFETGASIAHGTTVGKGTVFKENSFANIGVSVGSYSEVPAYTALGPGVQVPSDTDKLPHNVIIFGRGNFLKALSAAPLDPATFELLPNKRADVDYQYARPILLGIDTNGRKLDDPTDDPRFQYLMGVGARYAMDNQQLTPGHTFLSAIGYTPEEWQKAVVAASIKEAEGKEKLSDREQAILAFRKGRLESGGNGQWQNTTYGNWIRIYALIMQTVKTEDFINEQAKLNGPIVWQAAVMQSELLSLHMAREIITNNPEHDRKLAEDLRLLITGHQGLLGLPIADDDKDKVSEIYQDPKRLTEIIRATRDEVKLAEHAKIFLHPKWTIEAIGSDRFAGEEKVPFHPNPRQRIDCNTILKSLGYRLEKDLSIVRDVHTTSPAAAESTRDIVLSDVAEAVRIRAILNPKGIDIVNGISDGVRVQRSHGAVPIIGDDVIIVGDRENVYLGGAVIVEDGVTLVDSTVSSELRCMPVHLEGNGFSKEKSLTDIAEGLSVERYQGGYFEQAGFHIANREQVMARAAKDSVILGGLPEEGGKKGRQKVWVHGFILDGIAYGDATLGDEGCAVKKSIIAPGSVVGTDNKNGGLYAGNLARFSPDGKGWNGNTEQKAEFDAFLEQEPRFKAIDLGSEEARGAEIAAIAKEKRAEAKAKLEERIATYGPIYGISAQFQSAYHNLVLAKEVHEAAGVPIMRQERGLPVEKSPEIIDATIAAFEYALGIRQEIASYPLAAREFINLTNGRSTVLADVENSLRLLAVGLGKTDIIPVKDWPNRPLDTTFAEARTQAEKVLPLFEDKYYQATLVGPATNDRSQPELHTMIPKQELQERQYEHSKFSDDYILLLAEQVGRIRGQFQGLCRSAGLGITDRP
ncbi:MAG: hypothetical protein EB060_06285 [Proteobacteria bacterium]|nr:hypothetical protein [Pseudomonadota bacterium]